MNNKDYRPTLAQLRTFVTIAEHKHFGEAASKLQISQPSLSQALAALEQGLDVQLIERSTRRVIITAAGQALLPFAQTTLEAADNFLVQSRGANGPLAGPLTIGIIPTVAPYILPFLLPSIKEEFPKLEPFIVEEQTHNLLSQLRDGQIDLAILALPSELSGATDTPLFTERFFVVVPQGHPLAGREDLQLNDIKQLELLLLDDGHCLRDQIVDLCRAAQINPSETTNAITKAASLTTVMQLVSAGLGSSLIPESAIKTECADRNVSLAQFAEDVVAEREIGLVFRSSTARQEDFHKIGELVTAAFKRAKEK